MPGVPPEGRTFLRKRWVRGRGRRHHGPIMSGAEPDFTQEEIERGRRYHRPLYRLFFANAALSIAVLASLAFSPAGDRLFNELASLPWWARGLLFPALVVHQDRLGQLVGLLAAEVRREKETNQSVVYCSKCTEIGRFR